jgi:GNAT superfamily N-acetyltransferase
MAKVKARRTHREELPGIAVLRDAAAAGISAYPSRRTVLDLDMEVDPNLGHLITHDPDGFFTAVDRDETVGFGAAFVRSRQWVLAELWVLPQHRGRGAGELLLRRLLTYGDQSGAREYLALVPAEPAIQALLLRHCFVALAPVYHFELDRVTAAEFGKALVAQLSGRNVSTELIERRGQADVDRIDRVTRNITRQVDHTYWLKQRAFNAAFVRQGSRVAAYAYGGSDQLGPVAGSTTEAALAGLGWAIQLTLAQNDDATIPVRVPAPFASAIEALQDAGARLQATMMLFGVNTSLSFDRSIVGAPNLP